MVKIQDPQLAKRYSIKTFPALVYFRNGNPLLFEGDMQNEQSVLEWLIDDDNRELADEIEEVNDRMLERLLDESSLLVVSRYQLEYSVRTLIFSFLFYFFYFLFQVFFCEYSLSTRLLNLYKKLHNIWISISIL